MLVFTLVVVSYGSQKLRNGFVSFCYFISDRIFFISDRNVKFWFLFIEEYNFLICRLLGYLGFWTGFLNDSQSKFLNNESDLYIFYRYLIFLGICTSQINLSAVV